MEIRVRFDGPPGPLAGRFVEVENRQGKSIRVGTWKETGDGSGHWFLILNHGQTARSLVGRVSATARRAWRTCACGGRHVGQG